MEKDKQLPENIVQFKVKAWEVKKVNPVHKALAQMGTVLGVAGIAASAASFVHDNSSNREQEPTSNHQEFYLKDTNLEDSQEIEVSDQTFVVSIGSALVLVSALTKLRLDEE